MLTAILNEYCYNETDIDYAIEQDQFRLKGNDGVVKSIYDATAVETAKWPATLQIWVDEDKLEACRGNQTTIFPASGTFRTRAIWVLAALAMIFHPKK